jgi:hypothetical protein
MNMTAAQSSTKTTTFTGIAFTGFGRGKYRVEVDGQTVRVWDSTGCAYTTCHSLTAAQCARLVKKVGHP